MPEEKRDWPDETQSQAWHRAERMKLALYCRVYRGHTIPSPDPPDGYEITSVQIELKASKTTHVIIGADVDDACDNASVKLDELLTLCACARIMKGEHGGSREDVLVSRYKKTGATWGWSEWEMD